MLEHGGRLRAAAQRYGIPLAQWLDLSTGINPQAYVPPTLPLNVWQRLPEDDDELLPAAAAYYGNSQLLALAGSQQAIQLLPTLFAAQNVALVSPLYNEHPAAWQAAGHALIQADTLDLALAAANIVVLCNPNNPDGRLLPPQRLRDAAEALAARDGWLIVDEAFMDATPEFGLAAEAGRPLSRLIVLRSLGKFFGLAGARVGFVLGDLAVLEKLREKIGPWSLSHPARVVATAALNDTQWQITARSQLNAASAQLAALLQPHGEVHGCALFQYLLTPHAAKLHTALARHGILVRTFAEPSALRFGLPANNAEADRLALTLKRVFTESLP